MALLCNEMVKTDFFPTSVSINTDEMWLVSKLSEEYKWQIEQYVYAYKRSESFLPLLQ